ncbi:MAG TPA: GspE/PulE family protein [Candidatus Absconditabacterales bacterium]|nr:GspE/PulE family protein [Candidatus Absconditabacterales bacterium]
MLNNLSKTILERQDIESIKPDFEKVKILNRSAAEKIQAIIFDSEKNTFHILTTNNFPDHLQKLIKNLEEKGAKTKIFYTDFDSFNQIALDWYNQIEKQEEKKAEEKATNQNAEGNNAEQLIQQFFNEREKKDDGDFILEIIRLAFQAGSSDLHFQSEEKGIFMKMRKDGILKTVLEFSHEEFPKYLQKIKFISGVRMNIDYLPQDGRFDFMVNINGIQKKIDVRVNTMPGLRSESIVMRFLDSTNSIHSFTEIGFGGENLKSIQENLVKNTGMILVTGPTGAGKTTTIYSMIDTLNNGRKKIITLEDPIEYEVPGLQQSQINYKKGYDYEQGLKAVLRHDPEVILVGEIRTLETADIAINAALTGHLVFSTLHTNSAIETVSRLLNMGVQTYMLAPAINLIVGQRLVRKLCHCAIKRESNFAESEEIKKVLEKIHDIKPTKIIEFDGQIYHPVGCPDCNGEGYKGRIAIVETLEITEDIKQTIVESGKIIDIFAKARENGFLTLKEEGFIKMIDGQTTLEELRRVI